MSKTEILLVRHGETVWNVEGKFQGCSDSPLTEMGLRQAESIAYRLRHETISQIYSSDLLRAYRTAQFIAEARGGQPIVTDSRLREWHHGIFEGLTKVQIETTYPDLYPSYALDDPNFIIPKGESRAHMSQRALAVINDLAERHAGERFLVVTHGAFLSAIFRQILGLSLIDKRRFILRNVSLNIIAWQHDYWVVETLGDVSHLRPQHNG